MVFIPLALIGYIARMLSVRLTADFQHWLDVLPDKRAQVRIVARLRLAELGNLGE